MSSTNNYWTRHQNLRLSRRRFVGGSAVAMAGTAAMLAGCGDDDDDKTATGTTGPAGTTAATASGASPSAAANAPVKGGTLKLTKAQADDGMDPGLKVINMPEILTSMYNHTHIYKASENVFLMDAATKMEQPDAGTIRFTLRDGMKFHKDGKAVTAEDVAFTWSRFPDLLKNQGSQINEASWGFIDTVTAPDSKTVVVKLKQPSASATVLMASTAYGILNKAQVEASPNKNVQNEDAGAGAYTLDKRDPTGTRLVRFKDYYKHESPSKHFAVDGPFIEAIETRIIVDQSAVKSAFLAGDLDFMPVVADKLAFADFKGKNNISAQEVETTEARFLAFDNAKFVDKRARQAVSLAINYQALITTLYAGDGKYDGPVGIGLGGFALNQDTLKAARKFDAAEAKKLWEAAGKPMSKIRIECNQDPRGNTLGEFVANQLKQNLGVDTELLVHDTVTWVQRAREPQKQWELFVVPYNFTNTPETYNLTMMDPGAFAGVSWSYGLAPESSNNPDVLASAKEFRRLVDEQSKEINPAARKEKLNAVQKYALDNVVPGINMPVPGHSYLVYNKRVQNVVESDWLLGLGLRTQDLWIKA